MQHKKCKRNLQRHGWSPARHRTKSHGHCIDDRARTSLTPLEPGSHTCYHSLLSLPWVRHDPAASLREQEKPVGSEFWLEAGFPSQKIAYLTKRHGCQFAGFSGYLWAPAIFLWQVMHIMVALINELFSDTWLCPGLTLTARMIHLASSPLC